MKKDEMISKIKEVKIFKDDVRLDERLDKYYNKSLSFNSIRALVEDVIDITSEKFKQQLLREVGKK